MPPIRKTKQPPSPSVARRRNSRRAARPVAEERAGDQNVVLPPPEESEEYKKHIADRQLRMEDQSREYVKLMKWIEEDTIEVNNHRAKMVELGISHEPQYDEDGMRISRRKAHFDRLVKDIVNDTIRMRHRQQ